MLYAHQSYACLLIPDLQGESKESLPTVGEPSIFTEAGNRDIRRMRCFLCSQEKTQPHRKKTQQEGNEEKPRHTESNVGCELWDR